MNLSSEQVRENSAQYKTSVAIYGGFPKKPCINVKKTIDT